MSPFFLFLFSFLSFFFLLPFFLSLEDIYIRVDPTTTNRFLSIEDGNKIPHADRLEFLFRALQPVCD